MTPTGLLTTLYSFTGSDGAYPNAGVIQDTDGRLYGTTQSGGVGFHGSIFEITTDGILTTLHSFDSADGGTPHAALIQADDGSFYGPHNWAAPTTSARFSA